MHPDPVPPLPPIDPPTPIDDIRRGLGRLLQSLLPPHRPVIVRHTFVREDRTMLTRTYRLTASDTKPDQQVKSRRLQIFVDDDPASESDFLASDTITVPADAQVRVLLSDVNDLGESEASDPYEFTATGAGGGGPTTVPDKPGILSHTFVSEQDS